MADEQFPLEQFLGGKIAPQEQVLAGMQAAEDEQAKRFDFDTAKQAALADAVASLQRSLGDQVGAGLEEAAAGLKKVEQEFSAQKLAVPDLPHAEQRIFPGSIGLTRVPPYDYRWTWSNQDAGATVNVAADNGTGRLSFALDTSWNQAHASCMNGLGVFYRPMYNGLLHAVALPVFNYSWEAISAGSACHSDGWLGLYVGQYNLAGGFDRVVVSQQGLQWKSDEWFWASDQVQGSNPGYVVSAWFPVDTAHWYAIWVWSGASVWATAGWAGRAFAELSTAASKMNVGVPFIATALM